VKRYGKSNGGNKSGRSIAISTCKVRAEDGIYGRGGWTVVVRPWSSWWFERRSEGGPGAFSSMQVNLTVPLRIPAALIPSAYRGGTPTFALPAHGITSLARPPLFILHWAFARRLHHASVRALYLAGILRVPHLHTRTDKSPVTS